MAKQRSSKKLAATTPANNQQVRTDKWRLAPTPEQRGFLEQTLREYRRLVRALIGVVFTHWPEISTSKDPLTAVEVLIHKTAKRPSVKYQYFDRVFKKFPSYYRRAAINNAIGQVSSFVTQYIQWQSGIRSRRDAKPPRLTANTGVYPPLYQGQCIKFHDSYSSAEIKVFTGSDWVWTTIPVVSHRNRHNVNPAYTSKYAYDGSGLLKRDSQNYAKATFQTRKKYNADLNGSLNIAARYWYKVGAGFTDGVEYPTDNLSNPPLKLSSKKPNGSEVWVSKSTAYTPRTPVTLSTLWVRNPERGDWKDTPLTSRSRCKWGAFIASKSCRREAWMLKQQLPLNQASH